jgi:ectoine hydroxylase-related dioxygenase (phytanoyl-CoA dioxygenase family)
VRVVELTGAPGDVVLWHPSLFHAASSNASDRPRFMLTHTAFRGPREGSSAALGGQGG